jgi:hypothetical protein
VHGEGRKMRWILIEEDVSIWKLLFIMGFLALLIFALVQTAPSVEIQSVGIDGSGLRIIGYPRG